MLELKDICLTFNPGTVDEKKALSGLSLSVEKGEFISIIGANGAGKSTLFSAISGSVRIDSGSIILGGRNITNVPEYIRSRRIGRLFQDPMKGSAPGMTIEENLFLAAGHGGWFSGISRKDKEIFRERLAALGMGLENRMSQKVGSLSGGQRQALTLIMSTLNPPDILLLDEHTAALDPGTAEKVLKVTEDIVTENKLTCLMITHNMQSALDLGSRTIMMDHGNIILDYSGEERSHLTVSDLMNSFREKAGTELNNDRMLLS